MWLKPHEPIRRRVEDLPFTISRYKPKPLKQRYQDVGARERRVRN